MTEHAPSPKKLIPNRRRVVKRRKTGRNSLLNRLRRILDCMPFLVGYINTNQEYTYVNSAYEEKNWFGVPRRNLIGCTVREVVGDEEYAAIKPYIDRALSGEVVHYEIASVNTLTAVPYREATYIPDVCPVTGHVRGYVAYVNDISGRRGAEERIRWIAHHDALTGLPSRVLFRERLDEILAEAVSDGAPLAILYIDLNGFKSVNDTFGHQVGDAVLQQLAQRLSLALRESEFAARLGGDEFGVLLPHVADIKQAEEVSRRLNAAISEPVKVHEQTFFLGASIGIALYPDHAWKAGDLLEYADRAMFAVKRAAKP